MSDAAYFSLLLVDDEPKILSSLNRLFRRHNCRIFSATSGSKALEILEQETITVVISDMTMPIMNGAEFLTRVSRRQPDIERIVLTGQADLENTISAINSAGIFRYISKPWDESELQQAVADAVKNHQDKARQKDIQQTILEQNHTLKSHNTVLEKTVKHNLTELEETNSKLASAFEGEKRLRAERNKAERLSEEKSRFLATMSHEIRSPLNAVIAMNALLLESELSDEQRELAKIAHNGGQTLLALINDILDFSKIEAGNLKLYKKWFSIVEVTQSVVELLASHTIDKEVEIITVFSPETPYLILGDETRVRQILTNIINNAVKFTKIGGVIVRIGLSNNVPGIEIDVEDTGIGIHKSEQEKIFNEFVQADNSESRAYGGTGLGLSICQQLISLMGGHILLESQFGEGSKFKITLPCVKKDTLMSTSKKNTQHLVCIQSKNKILIKGLAEQLAFLERIAIDLEDIKHINSEYQSFTFITNIEDDSYLPASYEDQLRQCLQVQNPSLLGKPWKLVGLVSNDGIGKLKKTKDLGFSSLLRKPVRLCSIINHMLPESDGFKINNDDCDSVTSKQKNNRINGNKKAPKNIAARQYRLLLVEDSQANQAIVKAVLKGKNYIIDIANNGVEALSAVELKIYDAILMDISMPIMDGITATQKIRASDSCNKDTVIIAMTAKAFAEDQEQFLEAGGNDYISKPIDVPKFVMCLAKWLEAGALEAKPLNKQAKCATQQSDNIDTQDCNNLTPDKLIDPATLERLVGDVSKEVLLNVLDIYFNESRSRISAMVLLYQESSWQSLSDQAHALKSSSGSFGAKRLQETAIEIEKYANETDGFKLQQTMQTLTSLFENTVSALNAYCNNL